MKKHLFLLLMIFAAISFTSAQVVADFEDGTTGPLTLHVQGCGDYDNDAIHPVDETFMVIDNPDASGINTSSKVLKFIRRGTDNGGLPWGGFWANVDPNIDVTVNKYAHVMVWKPMISPLKFKLEGTPTLETGSMNMQADTGMWVDIVFDFSTLSGNYAVMSLMPDFEDPFATAEDVDIYIDNIQFTSDPNPIGGSITGMVADFENGTTGPLTLHVMGCGDYDNAEIHPVDETFMVVDNPDASGINTSSKVLKFIRRGTDNGGQPWGGFWANVDPNIDVTVNKYAHVMVWKPMISPLKFKMEGSPTLETASIYAQPAAGEWVDIVFDFSTLSGDYGVISLMPDFADPFATAEDVDIYIDNIQYTNDATPIGGGPETFSVKFSVDMSYQVTLGNFDPATDYVDIAGNFNGWNGDNDHLNGTLANIYSITIESDSFAAGYEVKFKFRINGDWVTSEFPNGGPDRTYTVVAGTNTVAVWYDDMQPPPPAGGVIADFEDDTWGSLTPHVMGCGDYDNDALHPVDETFMIIDNPDPSGINTSSKVLKFNRWGTDNGGLPWAGFWAQCSPPVNTTETKYIHYMVWKPVTSPLKFKLEGATQSEIFSTNEQTTTNGWQDMVFNFSEMADADYGVVALMPDFVDPFDRAETIEIYIDNIVINDNPNPITGIWNHNAENEISMYPNPFTTSINIDLTRDMNSITISNIVGQQLYKIENVSRGPINIDASTLDSGVYIITLTDKNNKTTSAKLMKN